MHSRARFAEWNRRGVSKGLGKLTLFQLACNAHEMLAHLRIVRKFFCANEIEHKSMRSVERG